MIRFLYRAGSDESRAWLIDSIQKDLQAGGKALLLVPEQETVAVERRMLALLPPSAQLCFEVLNFSRLANRAFRTLGGLSYRNATPAVAALLMWQTIGELLPFLRQYGSGAARDSALCELMLKTEAQCKTGCVDAQSLLLAAERLPEGEPLRDKLYDIGLTLSTYEVHLAERFDNAADDLNRLASLLSGPGKKLFADTHIYIDSFTDFTMQEIGVLRALFATAPTVTVTFPMNGPADEGLHLHAVKNTHKLLRRMANELGKPLHTEGENHSRPQDALAYFSQNLFRMTAEKAPLQMAKSGQIQLTACATPFEEATAAATEIHRLIRAGYRYRDITVVVREAADWIGILDATFEKEGIPCFLSEKTDITVRPLIKLIIEALRIHLGNWREEDVIGYLKTGLTGVSADDINLFESYVNVWHPRGEKAYNGSDFNKNPDGFSARCSQRGTRILEGANRVRHAIVPPLVTLFEALENAADATALCQALYDFLAALQIQDKLKAEAELRLRNGERREAQELSRLYSVTVDALEAIATALGTRKLTVAEFADALKLVFSRTDIGTIPTSADEVTVGSASMLRADHPKFVLILGLNEGLFPRTVGDDGLLSHADKKKLADLDIVFPATGTKLASDELFFLYRAVAAPKEGLWLSYAQNGCDGRSLSASIAITRLFALFPGLQKQLFAAGDPIDRIYTHSGAIETLSALSPATAEALRSHLEAVGIGAARSLRRPVVDSNATVSAPLAASLFSDKNLSPTHLERFASCRFQYYCKSILRLREEPTDKMTSAEIGTFIHYVLEHIVKTVRDNGSDFSAYDSERQEQMVNEICAQYCQKLLEVGGAFTPRTEMLLERLKVLARLIVTGLFAELRDSLFTPAFLELDLGAIGERPTVQVGKNSIPLAGTADRVDFWQDRDGRAYVRVADYKTGRKEFSMSDIEKGFSMQMPLYLHALCHGTHPILAKALNLPADTRFHPAGVSYFSSAIGSEKTNQSQDAKQALENAVDRLSHNGVLLSEPEVLHAMSLSNSEAILGKRKNQLSAQEFDALFEQLEKTITRIADEMRRGEAQACPTSDGDRNPCTYCAFSAVCRASKKPKSFKNH
ncbi:MAG: hypothetical protein E7585_05890 [Ruminococcaceae bacterium]|nr:hypothetical protein [Oscillospiraceae bacterium]